MKTMLQSLFRAPSFRCLPALVLGFGVLAGTGCAPSFKLEDAPPGFIEVNSYTSMGEAELRMKAPDNVGINITTESNFRGGTLALWADDMLRKLGERGYVLLRQEAVKSANGIEGTRFDFSYNPPGGDGHERFYTAVLFVTDEWRVIVQIAGRTELQADHQGDLQQVLQTIKIGGCKLGSKVCNSGQPRSFDTAAPTKPNKPAAEDGSGGGADDQADGGEGDQGETAPPEASPDEASSETPPA